MSDHMSYAETKKYLVAALKEAFPDVEFRVTKHNNTVTVRWTDGPTPAAVDLVASQFEGRSFDSSQDLAEIRTSRHPDTGRDVVWGIHYVNTHREYTREFLARIAAYVEQTYAGCQPLKLAPPTEFDGWQIEQDWDNRPEGRQVGDSFPDTANRLAKDTSIEALPLLELERTGIQPDTAKAEKFRKLAAGMQKTIDQKFADRLTNTHKRAQEDAYQREEGRRLQKVQASLLKLVEGWEQGTLPLILAGIDAKNQVEYLVLRQSPPSPQRESADFKRLRRAGLEHGDRFYRARQALLALIPDGTGEVTFEDKLREACSEVCRRQIPGFFPTPPSVIQTLLSRAAIDPGMAVLEPSAGRGDIADAIHAAYPTEHGGAAVAVDCIEINYTLREILTLKNHNVIGQDFLAEDPTSDYDRVVMNPPFENGADMQHVRRAFDWLRPGGRLSAVVSRAVQHDNKTAEAFRTWVDELGGSIEDLPDEAFTESDRPTSVRTCLVVLDKPDSTPSAADTPIVETVEAVVLPPTPSGGGAYRAYLDVKLNYPDELVLFPVGDFYELYGHDAERAAAAADLVLTTRRITRSHQVSVCGFPMKALDLYQERLFAAQHEIVVVHVNEAASYEVAQVIRQPRAVITEFPDPEDAGIDAMEAAADWTGDVVPCVISGIAGRKVIYVPQETGKDRSYTVSEVQAILDHLDELRAFAATFAEKTIS